MDITLQFEGTPIPPHAHEALNIWLSANQTRVLEAINGFGACNQIARQLADRSGVTLNVQAAEVPVTPEIAILFPASGYPLNMETEVRLVINALRITGDGIETAGLGKANILINPAFAAA